MSKVSKAEEASYAYQRELGMIDSVSDEHIVARRMGFYDGYRKAEKELALNWKDIREVDELLTLVYDPNSEESYYTRVLEEFKKWREGR